MKAVEVLCGLSFYRESVIPSTSRRSAIFAAFLLAAALSGCADSGEVIVLNMDVDTVVPGDGDLPSRASVEVFDIREEAELERTALNTSMGAIEFDPPESELVRELVQARADSLLAQQTDFHGPAKILCGIRVFDVRTPSTALYWDMTAEFELVLRIGNEDRSAAGSATGRTFIWPSRARIQAVTDKAFVELARNIDIALTELFALNMK